GERVPALALLPEVRRRDGKAVLLDRPQEEAGGALRRRPQIGVELLVAKLQPGRAVREEDRPGLVELVPAPRRCKRAVRPMPLEPQALRLLCSRQPAQS